MATDLKTVITIAVDSKAVRPNVEVARKALAELKKDAGTVGTAGTNALTGQFNSASAAATRLGGVMRGLLGPLAAIGTVAGVVALVRNVVATADAYKGVDSRLKLATQSQREYNAASAELFEISQRTRSDLSETVNLYSRVAGSIRDLNGSQEDALAVTEIINQSFKVSGASAASSAAGVQQLAQALASGVLRGDEFNSVMENSPRLAKALADGLGVPRGALRAMAEQGELTAEKVIKALLSQREVIDKEFKTLPVTIDQATTSIGNSFTRLASLIDSKLGLSSAIARLLQSVSDSIDETVDDSLGAERRLAALQAQRVDSAAFDGEVRLTERRIADLTNAELEGYQRRLQGAIDFNQAQRDLDRQAATAAFGGGNDAAGSRLAAAAAAADREVRLYQETLTRVQAVLEQRTQVEQQAADARLQVIVASISQEKKLLDQANKDLEAAGKRRKEIADAFAATQKAIDRGPARPDQRTDVVDAIDAIQRARAQLQGGLGRASDPKAALESAEQARQALEILATSGEVSKQFLSSLNAQAAQVADEAAKAQEADAQQKVDEITARLQKLKDEGANILKLQLDSTELDKQLDEVIAAAKEKARQNPVVIPTVIGQAQAAGQEAAQQKAGGGAVLGPGTSSSDSILVAMSNNEHVLTAAEVEAAGGHSAIYRLRALIRAGKLRGLIPGFAQGGGLSLPAVPRLASSAATAGAGAVNNLYLRLDGRTAGPFTGSDSSMRAVREMIATAALMVGGRR
ncbi:MAG: hypothetical protein FLDDKLPJ_00941 [Phycisphaerae bacterium]|nr:hypothetical protein [Phycisphaerae bacterium]